MKNLLTKTQHIYYIQRIIFCDVGVLIVRTLDSNSWDQSLTDLSTGRKVSILYLYDLKPVLKTILQYY